MSSFIGFEVEHTLVRDKKPVVFADFPHGKENPLETENALHHKDGPFFEMAMNPHADPESAWANYESALNEAVGIIGDVGKVELQTTVEYDSEELEKDPTSTEMGCSESKCVWGGKEDTPKEYQDNFRSSGVHVTFNSSNTPLVIANLDCTLGLYSVVFWEQLTKEQSVRRRKIYGRSGEYRSKEFGYEYRTLPSCVWSKDNVKFIYNVVSYCEDLDIKSKIIEYCQNKEVNPVQDAINNCDETKSRDIFQKINGFNIDDLSKVISEDK